MNKERGVLIPIGSFPTLVLALANTGKEYRSSRQTIATSSNPFTNLEATRDLLRSWEISGQVGEADLEQLQEVQKALQSFISGCEKHDHRFRNALEALNQFAAQCHWVHQLSETGTLVEKLSGPIAAVVAARCVTELSKVDFTRLKTCCWPPCELVFYDATRNRSAKWHAENPCGWRARAARNRAKERDEATE
ncbi:MAG TPA: CGNR zinc finger domain-containing protein [Ktedonobacteraceae bacterium]